MVFKEEKQNNSLIQKIKLKHRTVQAENIISIRSTAESMGNKGS